MNLHAIEAGALGFLRRPAESFDNARQLVIAQLARNLVGLLALRRVRLVIGDTKRTRRDGLRAVVQQRVTGPAAMPELGENFATLACTASVTFFHAETCASE